jgi:SAM-dependent methyltransferase
LKCSHCEAPLEHQFIDLGHQPPSNAYLSAGSGPGQASGPEVHVPLKVLVCESCWLVQLPSQHRAEELFTADYAYFSSVSSTWVEHARRYVTDMASRFSLNAGSFVVEIASNDGYLLQSVKALGIPCLGIEPTASTAAAARAKGIESLELFFGVETARKLATERRPADLIAANNVLAHVPDINDFVGGFHELLAPEGVATFEFPHLLQLVSGCQFDTIYHEHYSYLSLHAVRRIFEQQGLRVFDVELVPTHGGSLRVFACRATARTRAVTPRVSTVLEQEQAAGLLTRAYYAGFQSRAETVKLDLLSFLIEQKRRGRTVAGYGAAAKGNTLLNFAGVRSDLLPFVCDAAPSKQGRWLPGSHIPILAPQALKDRRPDFVLILPWNLKAEVMTAHRYIADWGGKFVTAVPALEIV